MCSVAFGLVGADKDPYGSFPRTTKSLTADARLAVAGVSRVKMTTPSSSVKSLPENAQSCEQHLINNIW
ncbi:hypothetical protein MRX96_027552 [Rhipicephalus microplus]